MPERDELEPVANGADEAALAVAARHALHDEELVAALAAGGLDAGDDASDRARAQGLVARCPACRALHDDIAAIGAATRASAAGSIPAPRDFRLTAEDAVRLGGTVRMPRTLGGLRRLLASFGRPVGASVATMGLVGVLVGTAMLGVGGAGGSAAPMGAGSAATTAPAADNGTIAGAVKATAGAEVGQGPDTAPAATQGAFTQPESSPPVRAAIEPAAIPWLLLLAVAAVVLGLGLFAAGVAAAREPGDGTRIH